MPTETTTPASAISKTTPFDEALTAKLMGAAGISSSSQTGIEDAINKAIAGTEKAVTSGAELIKSTSATEIADAQETAGQKMAAFQRGEGGYGQSVAAYREMTAVSDKHIADLQKKRDELLLQNDIAGASKVSDLQLKALEFKQNAAQQYFSNLLNVGQFQLQKTAQDEATNQFKQTLDLQKEQNKYEVQSKMSEIALQYGVTVMPGDTLASVVSRAQPNASKEQKARLAQLLKDTEDTSASISLDSILQDAITGTYYNQETGSNLPAMSPARAAVLAAGNATSLGIKVTKADMDNFVKKATKMKEDYDAQLAKAKAEAAGNSFWGNWTNFFGSDAADAARSELNTKITGLANGGTLEDLFKQ